MARAQRNRPPEDQPQSPVRDDAALGPTEDLDRQPDGVPHAAVALTAILAIGIALATVTAIVAGTWKFVAAIPLVIALVAGWAARRRDRAHPSI